MKYGFKIFLHGCELEHIFDSIIALNFAYPIAIQFKEYVKKNCMVEKHRYLQYLPKYQKLDIVFDFLREIKGMKVGYKEFKEGSPLILEDTFFDASMKDESNKAFQSYAELCILIRDLDHESKIEYVSER